MKIKMCFIIPNENFFLTLQKIFLNLTFLIIIDYMVLRRSSYDLLIVKVTISNFVRFQLLWQALKLLKVYFALVQDMSRFLGHLKFFCAPWECTNSTLTSCLFIFTSLTAWIQLTLWKVCPWSLQHIGQSWLHNSKFDYSMVAASSSWQHAT